MKKTLKEKVKAKAKALKEKVKAKAKSKCKGKCCKACKDCAILLTFALALCGCQSTTPASRATSATYGDIARAVAAAGCLRASARAVGGAVGSNPISLIVPCHRVIGADGSLTGYAGGVERKQLLLQISSRMVSRSAPPGA